MSIITLTTDWNKGDYYIASVKGAIYKQMPGASIIDISHNIETGSTIQAAFIVKNSYKNFPDNTIHILGVRTESSAEEPLLACKIDNQYFIGVDNGQFDLISKVKPEAIVEIEPNKFNLQLQSFPILNFYVDAACKLAKGGDIFTLGKEKDKIKIQPQFHEAIDENSINAQIVYTDSFGNGITNLTRETFERVGKGRKFDIYVRTRRNKISQLSNSYNDVPPGQLLALFNSINLLEVAMNSGPASDLLGLELKDSNVIVHFKPKY